jgi:hypothetical protein
MDIFFYLEIPNEWIACKMFLLASSSWLFPFQQAVIFQLNPAAGIPEKAIAFTSLDYTKQKHILKRLCQLSQFAKELRIYNTRYILPATSDVTHSHVPRYPFQSLPFGVVGLFSSSLNLQKNK